MSPFRKLLLAGVGVLALHGVQACASETELNPQPLPPQDVGEPKAPAEGASEDDRAADPGSLGGAADGATPEDGGADSGDASDAGAG